MSWNLSQLTDGSFKVVASPGASQFSTGGLIEFANGVDIEVGRGTTNAARTYIAFRNSAGVKNYVYVDTNAVVVSTTKP